MQVRQARLGGHRPDVPPLGLLGWPKNAQRLLLGLLSGLRRVVENPSKICGEAAGSETKMNPKGRPKRAKRASTEIKRFRCSPAEAKRWERAAQKAGVGFSEYVRLALEEFGSCKQSTK